MKNLILIFALLMLAACGPSFSASEFSPSDNAGGAIGLGQAGDPVGAAGAPSSSAGASSAIAGAGGNTEDLGGGGSGSAAGAAESGGGGAGSAAGAHQGGTGGAPSAGGATNAGASGSGGAAGSAPYVPPPCSGAVEVMGGGDNSLSTAPACLRTKEALNTIGCLNWDNRTVAVNGAAATCGVRQDFPPAIDGYNYIETGPGTTTVALIQWFLTAPATNACAALYWAKGEHYSPEQIMLDVCDLPSTSGCSPGSVLAFACIATSPECSTTEPGGATGWPSIWKIVATCQ
jgi:hypothetical protein